MDPFDEFEFKPLTEGLGFHKKQVDLKVDKKNAVEDTKVEELLNKFPELDEKPNVKPVDNSNIKPAFPRKDLENKKLKEVTYDDLKLELEAKRKNKPDAQKANLEFHERPDINDSELSERSKPKETGTSIEKHNSVKASMKEDNIVAVPDMAKSKYVETSLSISATIFDAIVIFGFANIFMAALLVATEIDVYVILLNGGLDLMTQFSIVLLFFSVMELYMVISRSFFGMSLGEWALDYQVGLPEEQKRTMYPLKLAWRCFVVAITGFILLPLLSKMFKKDITGIFSGIRLYRKED